MEIVIGLLMLSTGMAMTMRMYHHCVHPCRLTYKNRPQLQDLGE
jgi:hypothetical protein